MGRAAGCICMQDKCQVHDNVKFGDNTLEMTNRERERERERERTRFGLGQLRR